MHQNDTAEHAVIGQAQPDGLAHAMVELPRTGPLPVLRGLLRCTPEDFQVDEELPFAPDGSGEHLLLRVRKRSTNTDWLARRIARVAGVRPMDVGYAGLKDRHAMTSQWFSVWLGQKPDPDLAALEDEQVQVLEAQRHGRKLRRGALQQNRFRIRLRQLAGDRAATEAVLQRIATAGVPNYFGEQRFGRGGANLERAAAMFAGTRIRDRQQRSMLLSSARSFLFNLVLARRVSDGSWAAGLDGDVIMLDGRRSVFPAPQLDAELRQRLAQQEIHPTGPLWGRGTTLATDRCAEIEQTVLAPFALWRNGLEHVGLDQERRALRCRVRDLAWQFYDDALQVDFALGPGSYATMVLREFVEYENATAPGADDDL